MEITKKFSIKQALSYGFSQFFEHAGIILSAMLVGIAITIGLFIVALAGLFILFFSMSRFVNVPSEIAQSGVSAYLDSLFSTMSVPTAVISFIVLVIYSWYIYSLYLGFIRILFDIYEFNSSSVSRLFSCRPIALKAWIIEFLYRFLVAIGLLLLFVPGFFVIALYGFAQFVIIDRDRGIFESFSYSAKLAQGAKMELLAFYVVIGLIMTASSIFPPLWLIVYPSLLLASVFVYKKLQEQTA